MTSIYLWCALAALVAMSFGVGFIAGRLSLRTAEEGWEPATEDSVFDDLDASASAWAHEHGRPDITPLVAAKLRLAHELFLRSRR